tara:strand:- start:175 stop:462 length:288 start_codon:yes stop_codon:yes gene_type:complete
MPVIAPSGSRPAGRQRAEGRPRSTAITIRRAKIAIAGRTPRPGVIAAMVRGGRCVKRAGGPARGVGREKSMFRLPMNLTASSGDTVRAKPLISAT